MQTGGKKSLLDPRTKLLLLIVIAIFVLGGAGGQDMQVFRIILSALPFLLLLVSGKIKTWLMGSAILMMCFILQSHILPSLEGTWAFLILAVCGIVTGLIPSIMMGRYVMATTTVSEFIAAMERIHMTEKLTIPLSVMFRFFPTVQEEFAAIDDAMRMRDIRIGGRKRSGIIEYRMIPMMMCCVKIGDELSAAALTRGLGAPVRRTNICRIGFGILDFMILGFCAVVLIFWVLAVLGIKFSAPAAAVALCFVKQGGLG